MSTRVLRNRKSKTMVNVTTGAKRKKGGKTISSDFNVNTFTDPEKELTSIKSEAVDDIIKTETENCTPIKSEPIEDLFDKPVLRVTLRPRKERVNYAFKSEHNTPTEDTIYQESDDYNESDESEKSETESSDGELFSKKKKKLDRTETSSFLEVLNSVDLTDEENEYRLQRQKNMQDRFKVLSSLEVNDDLSELKSVAVTRTIKTTPKPKSVRKPARKPFTLNPTKRSLRLLNRSLNLTSESNVTDTEVLLGTEALIEPPAEERKMTDEYIPFMDDGAENNLPEALESLKNDLCIPYEGTSDFCKCDLPKYCEIIQSCKMRDSPQKVIKQRIVSLDIHPSEKRLIILTGDKQGNIALQEITKETGIEVKAHGYNVNCVSFGKQDNTKFFSTSLEGTVRQGDVNNSNLQLIYSAAEKEHTTWHHEFGHSLLVAEGEGNVKLIDLRAPTEEYVNFKCHSRSVRTVQLHPTDENYFLTGSGIGEYGIWDIRKPSYKKLEPIVHQTFSKALTSAFFSAQGKYVLTTCNDDTIRVFNVVDLLKSVQETYIFHNNHGGRWLSVFKARWHPQREDAFIVGSMMKNPNRIQVYQKSGKMIHQLTSAEMVTFTPVVAAHPSLPVIAGGNGSGKVHIFSPYASLGDIYS